MKVSNIALFDFLTADRKSKSIDCRDIVEVVNIIAICLFTDLKVLVLINCNLTSFNVDLRLVALEGLYLYDNKLVTISGVSTCGKLLRLFISGNQL